MRGEKRLLLAMKLRAFEMTAAIRKSYWSPGKGLKYGWDFILHPDPIKWHEPVVLLMGITSYAETVSKSVSYDQVSAKTIEVKRKIRKVAGFSRLNVSYRFPKMNSCKQHVVQITLEDQSTEVVANLNGCVVSKGDSLYTIFSSIKEAIQFLIKLKKYQFWISNEHSVINCPTQYEPDVLNTFCGMQAVKIQNSTRACMSSLALFFPAGNFVVF